MRIKFVGGIVLTTVALLLIFAIALSAQEVACPNSGWLLGEGSSPARVQGIAHGSFEAWQDGWTFSHEDHFDRVVVTPADGLDALVLTVWTIVPGEQPVIAQRMLLRAVTGTPCLYAAAIRPGYYLMLGHAPAFADHEHDGVLPVKAQPMKRS